MYSHSFKKAINIMMAILLASSVVGCSKSSSSKKSAKPKAVKNKFLEYRKPKDNLFIQKGGYSKKSKTNPFSGKPTEQTENKLSDTVVYEKQTEPKTSETPSPISYKMEKKGSRNGFLKSVASVISSIFKPKTSNMTQVASKSDVYRPLVNKMVIAGTYSPDHSNLIEQGSYDYEYTDKETYMEDINIEPIAQIDSTPLTKASFKHSKSKIKQKKKDNNYITTNLIAPTTAKASIDIKQDYNSSTYNDQSNIKKELSISLSGILNVSKMLYGISSEEPTPDVDVTIPDIKDGDLKHKKGDPTPTLKDIPPIPTETSFKES